MTPAEFQAFPGPLLEGAPDKAIRAAARKVVRENGLDFAMKGAADIGSTPGCTEGEYLSLMGGIAEQLVRDQKAEAKRG